MNQAGYPINMKVLALFALIAGLFLLSMNMLNAQTAPEFLISWKAVNFIPSDYSEKVFPSNGSQVEVSFDLIDKNKIVNLANNEISWFVNNEVVAQKNGLKSIRFTAAGNSNQSVRITISGYNDAELEETIIIPIVKPKIIIDTREPIKYALNRTELPLRNYIIEMRPFFFNVDSLSDLDLNWRLNGGVVAADPENPEFLALDLKSDGKPKQTELNLSASAGNKSNILELANKTINYLVR